MTKKKPLIHQLTWIILSFILLSMAVQAVEKPQIILKSSSSQNDELKLEWWVEGLRGQTTTNAKLLIDNISVPITQLELEPTRSQSVCYMLVVDTSKSMIKKGKQRIKSIDDLKGLLKTTIQVKPAQHALGLMVFGSKVRTIVPPTQDKALLLSAVDNIKFDQDRTQLFRFIENGVTEMAQCPLNYRRVLLLLSDGFAEDKAFNVDDAVSFFRKNKISIYGFITKNSDDKAIYLAEYTGGWGAEPSDLEQQNLAKTITNFYAASNSGGNLIASLPQTIQNPIAQLQLMLSDGAKLTIESPVGLRSISPPLPIWKKNLMEWFPWLTENQLKYALWGLGLLLLLLFGLLLVFLLRRRSPTQEESPDPVGFLVRNGESYPILPGINSLGFLPDNDVVIEDDTVGRTHATLHYQGDGDVILTDLNSLNQSRVNNGNPIQRPTSIRDGDTISLGNWQATYQQAR